MRTQFLIEQLRALMAQAEPPLKLQARPGGAEAWKAKVRSTVVAALGAENNLVEKLDKNRYTAAAIINGTSAAERTFAFNAGVERAKGWIEAAIYELELLQGDASPIDRSSIDPDLWEHMGALVSAEDGGKVASQTAILTEDRMRKWAQLERSLVGKNLFSKALADDGMLRLGSQRGEWEGWRALGTGLAQATSNVERHHLDDREDGKRYVIGVLGLASLLLTQMRYQHPDATTTTAE